MDLILVAGLWMPSSVWAQTSAELERLGHRPIPVAVPGADDHDASATLDDQVAAVLAAIDASAESGSRPVVVGHSAAANLAWLAADRRPDQIAAAVLVGGFPNADGEHYAPSLPMADGVMPFPGWEPFEGPDSADLDEAARARLASVAIPVPGAVATAQVDLTDERRYAVPVVLVCPEYSPADIAEWVAGGHLPEVPRIEDVRYVDLDSGHWPMESCPAELARVLAQIADDLRLGP